MKRIYITSVPLDSNFPLLPYPAPAANYTMNVPVRPTCYPIVPVVEDTAREGDEVKIIAVRQKNSPHSENLAILHRELDALGVPYTLVDLTMPETQQKDQLVALFEALTNCMEDECCYYACATFGTKTYPLVLSSALHYAEKILKNTEVKGIYYRELTRVDGQVRSAAQYDISELFTLDSIIDFAAENDVRDKRAFVRLVLHPEQGV